MIVKNINRTNGKETEIDFEDLDLKDSENLTFTITDKVINRKNKLKPISIFS